MSDISIIAIDGPSASGKTTLACALAARLGFLYFDTGVMYRAVTLAALIQGLDVHNEEQVVKLSKELVIDVLPPTVDDGRYSTVMLGDQDVTHKLRTAEVDAAVSFPSSYQGVRDAMTTIQRRIGERGRVVMVGRDIGTVVLPDADLKIFLDASVEVRARRRWEECQMNGRGDSYAEILEAMHKRDAIDTTREVAPLKPAEDALIFDTTTLPIEDVLQHFIKLIANHNHSDSGG